MFKFLTRFLDLNQKEIDRFQAKISQINAFETKLAKLKTPKDFAAITADLKNRLADGATLDDLLPEALAAVREASDRAIGLRHFDVQLIAAMAFHEGRVAEQKTG